MKKSFIKEPLFWILLVVFAPAGIIYALYYSYKQSEEQRKINEKEINSTFSKESENLALGKTSVSFIFKKNPLQFLILSKPLLIINDGEPNELDDKIPLTLTIPNLSKIKFSVPYMGSEAGTVKKALKLEPNQDYVVEFTLGLFVFSPASVKINKKTK